MLAFTLFCLHKRHVEAAARSGIQDAHQCSLCIAITDVKALHVVFPPITASALLRATSLTAPRLPEPSEKHSLRVRNQTPAAPDPASAGSDRSDRRFPAKPETRA